MSFTLADPTEWWWEISPEIQTPDRQQSQYSSDRARWTAYLNQVCLNTALQELQHDGITATRGSGPSVWEFVNGCAIVVEGQRWILIPSETIDDMLEVPQEWVDIPEWAGDYYLGVQVRSADQALRVWGYTTHQALKELGTYDVDDRQYCLSGQLTRNLTVFEVARRRCEESTRGAIAPLPTLLSAQAANLIQRLGNPSVTFPREAVPFHLWAALLANESWREQLYQQRCGNHVSRIGNWLRGEIESVWQTLETLMSPPSVTTEWRGEFRPSTGINLMTFDVNRAKVLEFEAHQVMVVMGISALNETDVSIGLQVYVVGDRRSEMLQVRLLNDQGEEEGQARAVESESIQLQFDGQIGEQFSIEVCLAGQCLTETFII